MIPAVFPGQRTLCLEVPSLITPSQLHKSRVLSWEPGIWGTTMQNIFQLDTILSTNFGGGRGRGRRGE